MKRLLKEGLQMLITLIILLMVMWALVAPANAESDTYYILGNRNVVKAINDDPEGFGPRIIDCQSKNSTDPVGCIIAAEKVKQEKKQFAAKKRQLASK